MSTSPHTPTDAEIHGMEMEYSALRSEIVKRIEMRQQIVAITLTLAGVFLAFGASTASVVLIYPLLAMFLGFGWAQNDFRIKESARYIRDHLEGKIPGLGYEGHVQRQREATPISRGIGLSYIGICFLTQWMAIGIGALKFTTGPLEWILLGVDLIAVAAVVWLMIQALRGWAKTA